MGFLEQFVKWIASCITSPRFSISLNGGLIGFFEGARGARQGVPLSPYLFAIAMNVLSTLLMVVVAYGVFKFHPKYLRVRLSHLSFADDLLIFAKVLPILLLVFGVS